MKKLPILIIAAIIAVSFYGSVQAQNLEIQLNSHTYTNGYDVSCHGAQNGSIEAICINGSEPFAFVWSNGATTQTIDNLAVGTYTVTVYDWNNSYGQKEITLREPEVLETFLTADECGGGTNICQQGASTGHIYSEIRGGSPPYTYLWNTGSVSQTIDGVPAGTYTLSVTDINGCTSAQYITLTEPSALHIVSITSPKHHGFNISCTGQSDGVINLNVAGGIPPYSFQWNNGSMDQNPQDLIARVYMVRVYDQNGAMVTGHITLTQPPAINIVMTPSIYSNGFNLSTFNSLDGSITTNVTGGAAPYTYSWQSFPLKTTANLSNLSAGSYELIVFDANGCVGRANSDIRQPERERDEWTMNGNYGTNPANQFIGTSDSVDLVIKTNNIEVLRLNANGRLKLNSTTNVSSTNLDLLFVDANGILQVGPKPCQQSFVFPWTLGGNYLTGNALTDFIGTCNNYDFVMYANGSEKMRLKTNGNIGIGTTSPITKLQVIGSAMFTSVSGIPISAPYIKGGNTYTNATAPDYTWYNDLNTGIFHTLHTIGFGVNGKSVLSIKEYGNYTGGKVEIGNLSSQAGALSIASDATQFGPFIDLVNPTSNWRIIGPINTQGHPLSFSFYDNGTNNWSEVMTLMHDATTNKSTVAIGYTAAQVYNNASGNNHAIDYKLIVRGKFGADEIWCSTSGDWPDYVFSKNYKMLSLGELENYLSKNNHLPGIASAKEINAQDKINVAEMQKQQQEKIEELFLYIVELKKEIDKLKNK